MCGIVGAVSSRKIVRSCAGLQRLEYRARLVWRRGLRRRVAACASHRRVANCWRRSHGALQGTTGSPTAGPPWRTGVHNAHPHFSHGPGTDAAGKAGRIAVVQRHHRRIIRSCVQRSGQGLCVCQPDRYRSHLHLIDSLYEGDLFEVCEGRRRAVARRLRDRRVLQGRTHRVIGARAGSP